MKTVGRILFVVAAVLALSHLPAPRSLAQSDDVEALNKMIVELTQAKKFAEAVPLAERVVSIQERTRGRDHPDVAKALRTLAQLYRAQGRIAEAEALEKRARGQVQRLMGDTPTEWPDRDNMVPAAPGRPPPAAPAARPQPAPSRDFAVTTRSAPKSNVRPTGPSTNQNTVSATPQALPDFPWPPPAASASYVLARNMLKSRTTVGEVVETIVSALERTGYVERSFFRTQADGIALVTRLERINDDGTARAEGDRWPAAMQNHRSATDLVSFFRGLFYVDRGRYRVIVFVLQDLPFVQSPGGITGQEARAWLREGANVLPRDVANRPFGDGNCSVLVYEFASDGTAVRKIESRLTGKQHLEKAGVLSYLEKAN